MRFVLFAFLLTLLPVTSTCQRFGDKEFKKLESDAHKAFLNEYYTDAYEMYVFLDSLKPRNGSLNYMIGLSCMRLIIHRERSLRYFKKALRYGYEGVVQPNLIYNYEHNYYESEDFNFNLARAHHLNYKFEKAIGFYNEFLQEVVEKYGHHHRDHVLVVRKMIEECKVGMALTSDTLDITISRVEGGINTEFEEIAPIITADESMLIFTSRRPNKANLSKDHNDKNPENIYFSNNLGEGQWTVPQLLGGDVLNDVNNESALALSPDGNKLIVYKNNKHGTGDIFYSLLDGGKWNPLVKFPDGVNSSSLESSASISNDKSMLFFTSNRPGGYGGEDIYVAFKDDSGNWGNIKNLGETINTPYDDESPYIHPDGKTLFFSSRGHETMGGFDVFKSSFDEQDSLWTQPVNMGFPINTPENDMFFVWSADGKRAYFSSHRADSYGEDDIYMLEINDHSHEKTPLVLLSGEIRSAKSHKPLGAKVMIVNNKTQQVVSEVFSNRVTGRYTMVLKPGLDYGMMVEHEYYLPYSDNINVESKKSYYERTIDIDLQIIEEGAFVELHNIFFEFDSWQLSPESFGELDRFYTFILQNPQLMIEIAGHTDYIGSEEVNLKMSQGRVQCIVNYLRKKGLSKQRIVAKGYGEQYPKASNSTKEGRAQNRRTELIIHYPDEDQAWKKGYYHQNELGNHRKTNK